MEAEKLVQEKINKTGTVGSEQTEFEKGVCTDGETKESEEH